MGVHLLLKNSRKDEHTGVPPKGCMGILVGTGGEEPQRFVVPVVYLNHPIFLSLLKEAEEEYGFEQKGAITIPCHVEHFRQVQGIIDRDTGIHGLHGHGHGHGHVVHGGNHQNHNHFPIVGCFRA
jgi:SAUR family protein